MQQFDEVRAQFPGQQPLIQLVDGTPQYVAERASQAPTQSRSRTMHVIAFDRDEGNLVDVLAAVLAVADEVGADSDQRLSAGLGRSRRVVPRRRHREARARHHRR